MILRTTIDLRQEDRWARCSFEQLAFLQPQVRLRGLYKVGSHYIILIDDDLTTSKATNGQTLQEWFHNHRVITSPVTLANSIPEIAKKVSLRTRTQLVTVSGEPLSMNALIYTINLSFPPTIPHFSTEENIEKQTIKLIFSGKLKRKTLRKIQNVLKALGTPLCFEVYESNDGVVKSKFGKHEALQLILSRDYTNISKGMRLLAEKDEEFWRSHREELFTNSKLCSKDILPRTFRKNCSACVIDASVLPTSNIRNYLTVFDKVIIAPPIENNENIIMQSLGVSWDDLLELTAIGRVAFALPQSIHRYYPSGIKKIADSYPDQIILSRQLAAAIMLDTRHRFPFFYPCFDTEERYALLHELSSIVQTISNLDAKRNMQSLINILGNHYSTAEIMVHNRGAIATHALGLGNLFSGIHKSITGKEHFLEFYSATATVEMGTALGATVIPFSNPNGTYSEENITDVLAEFYSGIGKSSYSTYKSQHKTILAGLLSINEDVPVIELAKAFHSRDVNNLRELVCKISNNAGPETSEISDAIIRFNKEVLQFEKKTKRIAEIDIKGLLRSTATAGTVAFSFFTGVPIWAKLTFGLSPFALWVLSLIAAKRSHLGILAPTIDRLAAIAKRSHPSTVLVARLRKESSLLS